MKIAILVPFYNESRNLKFFIGEWYKYRNFFIKFKIRPFFFFIDDGSSDNSVDTIKENAKKIKYKIIKKKKLWSWRFMQIRLQTNFKKI